ncbi:MAG: RNA pseudouridine synthase [Crocinitomicaceae bacterium]|nr:RNA pseudouridine synthase [Crocinitomicaceae bacterium]
MNSDETYKEGEEQEQEEMVEHHRYVADPGQTLLRIDKFLNDRLPKMSRNKIQQAAKSGNILVNGEVVKSNYKVKPDDEISLVFTHEKEEFTVEPEPIPLNIVYEDDEVLVINKPAGLVVHPGHGNKTGTLAHGLLHHIRNLPESPSGIDRPGIVHRIDKLTSGLMVVGKTEHALNSLAMQFFNREIERKYWALVWGNLEEDGRIEGHIGRSLKNRKMMDVFPDGEYGKTAITNYRVLEKLLYVTLVECKLETGRTHQIRVHFKYIGHPLFSDPEYGGDRILKGTTFTKYKQFVQNCFDTLPRQALHAKSLGFTHPGTGEWMFFETELPEDFETVLEKWRKYSHYRDE